MRDSARDTQNEYPGISVVEPSNPQAVMTVQQFLDVRMNRLHKMIQYVDELGLYMVIHGAVTLAIMVRLLLEEEPLFEYGLVLFIPFYLYKLFSASIMCSKAKSIR